MSSTSSEILSITQVNEIVPGMMFTPEYIVYNDFGLLNIHPQRLHIGFVGMAYVTEGRMSIRLNDKDVIVNKGQILLVKKGDYLSDPMFSVDCNGWIFASSEVMTVAGNNSRAFTQLYSLSDERRIIDIPQSVENIIVYYGKIAEEKFRMGFKDIRLTLIAMAQDLMQVLLLNTTAGDTSHPTASVIYKRFNALLMESQPKPREVKWYADSLRVTPKYLTMVSKRLSGRCVSEWIDEAVMADVRRMMIHTEDNVKVIAAKTGFNNAAFFGKYVKKHTGMTPRQLREHLRKSKDSD